MQRTRDKYILLFISIILIFVSFFISPKFLKAQDGVQVWGEGDIAKTAIEEQTGMRAQDPRITIVNIIRIFLGFLGVIAVVIIIYAGYLWMTAGGNAEQIETAKMLMRNAAIGLAIILSAFAIVSFILSKLIAATGGGGGLPGQACSEGDAPRTCGCDGLMSCQQIDGKWRWSGCVGSDCGGGDSFKITSTSPKNEDVNVIRNAKIRLYFNKTIDAGTVVADTFTVKSGGADIAGSVSVNGRVIEFTPSSPCPTDSCAGAEAKCFSENMNVAVVAVSPNSLTNTPGIKSADGKNLECTGAMCSFSFTTGGVIDCESPEAELIAPGQICAETEHKFGVNSSDESSSVEKIEFFVNGTKDGEAVNGDGANPFNIAPTDPNAFTWDSAGYNEKSVNVKAVAFDMDDHSASDAKTMQIRPAHCCNGVKDADEKSIDCGGADCAACKGAACGINMELSCGDNNCDDNKCASGFCNCGTYADGTASDDSCQEKGYSASVANQCCVCEEKPEIYWIKEPNGAPGNLVTIGGRNFGAAQGNGKVEFIKDGNIISASLASVVNNECVGAWSDTKIIVQVPPNTVSGEYAVRVTANTGFSDSEKFTVNTTERPGLCLAYKEINGEKKSEGKFEEKTNLAGINLDDIDNREEIFFGNSKADISSDIRAGALLIQNAAVPNLTGGGLTVFVKDIDREKSNPVDFTILESSKTPRIYGFEPKAGHSGDYVRIWGQGFGSEQKSSTVKFGEAIGSFSFPDDCLKSYWSDNQIIVKVPGGLAFGDYAIKAEIALDGDGKMALTHSDKLYVGDYCSSDYAACGEGGEGEEGEEDEEGCEGRGNCVTSVRPGLCKIMPTMGPAKTPVSFYGENFGANIGRAEFNGEKEIDEAGKKVKKVEKTRVIPAEWTKGTGGGADIAKAAVPIVDIGDPADVNDDLPVTPKPGDIEVISASGLASNGMWFEVGSCTDSAQCNISGGNTSFVCCGDNSVYKGACMENQNACGFVLSPPTDYIWSFTTESPTVSALCSKLKDETSCVSASDSINCCWEDFDNATICRAEGTCYKKIPRVIEHCGYNQSALACKDNIGGPSPSPWAGDPRYETIVGHPGGDQACIDSKIWAEFNVEMGANFNTNTVKVMQCQTCSDCKFIESCESDIAGVISIQSKIFEFIPTSDLVAETWYEVILKSSSENDIKSAEGVALDGNRDGIEGGDYKWIFKTRAADNKCELGCPTVAPDKFTAINKTAKKYSGEVTAEDNKCVLLDRELQWDWNLRENEQNTDKARFCDNNTCACCNPNNEDCAGSDWKCVEPLKETLGNIPVKVKGEVSVRGQKKSDYGELYIDFTNFSVESFWPDCQESCLNAAVGARFSGEIDVTTIAGNVLIEGDGVEGKEGEEGRDKKEVILKNLSLKVNTKYRVIIKGGENGLRNMKGGGLDGLNYDSDEDDVKDAFSWEFKTGEKPCEVATVSVEPAYGVVGQIGDGLMYEAMPQTVNDICKGQRLDAYSYDWNWNSGAAFASVSNYPECGNGIVEKGEDCDEGEWVEGKDGEDGREGNDGTVCSATCTNVGNNKKCWALSGCCGNVATDSGEECDGQEWCSDKCLLKGSNVSYNSFCGNGGALESGEECELGEQGCSSICLWMGTATACSEDITENCCGNGQDEEGWEECDEGEWIVEPVNGEGGIKGNLDDGIGCSSKCLREGVAKCSGECCGNGRIDAGEDCDEGKRVEGKDGEDGREGNDGTACSAICTNAGTVACSDSVNKDCCGNGVIEAGEDCDEQYGCGATCLHTGTATETTGTSTPYQFVKAIDGPAAGQTATTTDIAAQVKEGINWTKQGAGKFTIQCGAKSDNECPNTQNPDSLNWGVGKNTCCYQRPIVVSPLENLENICPNGAINVVFDQIMDKDGLEKAGILEKRSDGVCPAVLGETASKVQSSKFKVQSLDGEEGKEGEEGGELDLPAQAGIGNWKLEIKKLFYKLFNIFIGNGLISLDNLKTTPQGMALNTSSAIADVSAAIHNNNISYNNNLSKSKTADEAVLDRGGEQGSRTLSLKGINQVSVGDASAGAILSTRRHCFNYSIGNKNFQNKNIFIAEDVVDSLRNWVPPTDITYNSISENFVNAIYPESIFYLLKFAERALVQSFTDVKTHLAGLVNFAKADGENWCKVGQKIISRTNTAEATIMPTALLESGAEYRLNFDGLKSISGVAVADTADANKIKVSARSEICLVDRVDVLIDYTFSNATTTDDIFICAGRDDCGVKTETTLDDDANPAPGTGNQHLYRAYALDKDGNELAADFTWLEYDSYANQGAIRIEDGGLSQKYITAFPLEEAKASVEIGAYDGYGYDSAATSTVDIQLYLCENPWPPISEFPYEDSEYNFSTYVCLDAGAENDAADNFTGFGKTCAAGDDRGKHCEDSDGCANTGICASDKCVAGTENASNACFVDTDCGDVECKINPIGSYKVCHAATVNGGRRCSTNNECGVWNTGCGFTCAGGVNQGKMCDVVDDCPDGSCAGTCYDWTFDANSSCNSNADCWNDDLPITKDPEKCETKVLKEYLWVEE